MAAIELKQASIPELHMPPVDTAVATLRYDADSDTLYFRRATGPGASVYIEAGAWLRIDPSTGEVCGFDIEGLEHDFLEHHSELWAVWKSSFGELTGTGLSRNAVLLLRSIWKSLNDKRVPALHFRTA